MKAFETESTGIFNSQISTPNTKISEERYTRMFEFDLPIENGGTSYVDGNSEAITPNVLICAKPHQKRHSKFPFKCYYMHINIYDEDVYSAAAALPDFVRIKDPNEYVLLFKELIKYGNSDREYDKYMLYSRFLKLLYLIGCESDANRSEIGGKLSDTAVNTAIGYIENHLSDDLSLEKVAYAVHSSPIYFHNRFKSATGKTLHVFVEDKRIEKSVYLMQTTDMTLAEIAYSCGFSSQSYYSYAFKRKMQTTPRKYAKLINSKYEQ